MISLGAAALWLVAANVIGLLPSRDRHWRAAYGLIAVGLPVLVWLGWENGPWLAAVFLAAGAWILRWPVWYGVRWVRRVLGGG